MSRKIKICILSEFGHSLISGKGECVGGAEVQTSTLAKELTKRSYDVSFVTFGKIDDFSYQVIEGVEVYNAFDNKFSGYSYLFPQNIYRLIKTLKKINADVYIKKGYGPLTGIIALLAKLQNKIFLYVASSEKDVSTNLGISASTKLKNILYRLGVKYSHKVICQTNHQKNLLKQNMDKQGMIIKNLYPLPKINDSQGDSSKLKILWIGRLIKSKRAELFLKLAKKLPEYKFWMIAISHRAELGYYNKIKENAKKIKNLDFIGFIPHDEIDKYYRKSSLLINTSTSEGFPNTFLEAWGNFIPVISLGFDPDEIISKHKLGLYLENFDDLVENTKMLQKNNNLRRKMGIQSRKYVEKEHNVDLIVNKYEKFFNEIKLTKR